MAGVKGSYQDVQRFGAAMGMLTHKFGFAAELIAEAHQELATPSPQNTRLYEARRAAGEKGKATRRARAAAGGKY